MKIGISACLCGQKTRYDGSDKKDEEILKQLEGHELVPICPEIAAGFPVPRECIEIRDGRVFDKNGNDLTDQLEKGCLSCLEQIQDCDLIILKERSPSCGVRTIYDGTFTGTIIKGSGLFTQTCLKQGIPVLSEDDMKEEGL